jgi:hypothetical protein
LVGNQNFSIAFQKETSVSGNGYHWIEQWLVLEQDWLFGSLRILPITCLTENR